MAKKKNTGTVAVVLETDLSQAKPFDEASLGDMDKRIFASLTEVNRKQIREGYAVQVIDLESGAVIASFNMEGYRPPQSSIEYFARRILPKIKEYYREHPALAASLADKKPEDKK